MRKKEKQQLQQEKPNATPEELKAYLEQLLPTLYEEMDELQELAEDEEEDYADFEARLNIEGAISAYEDIYRRIGGYN